MEEKNYVSDCKDRLDSEIYGYFTNLASPRQKKKSVFCLIAGDSDIETISDLVAHCGYTEKSILKKRVILRIIEE